MMQDYSLCLAWSWEHDAGFVELLRLACGSRGVTLLEVTPQTLPAVALDLEHGRLGFIALLDRASDVDQAFLVLANWARDRKAVHFNEWAKARRAWNKAVMHAEFLAACIPVPRTIILPSLVEQPCVPPEDLAALGPTFTIKPACQGGGDGVVLMATAWHQVVTARSEYPDDPYLVQSSIAPIEHGSRPAWFRVLYCSGCVYPCWWDQRTHVYASVSKTEESDLGLTALRNITARIAAVSGLDLFSTEIAQTGAGQFFVVDYVNDPVDLRLQSGASDGVPDLIVQDIAARLAALALDCRRPAAPAPMLSPDLGDPD